VAGCVATHCGHAIAGASAHVSSARAVASITGTASTTTYTESSFAITIIKFYAFWLADIGKLVYRALAAACVVCISDAITGTILANTDRGVLSSGAASTI
jgi:hypothetical protein